MRVPAVAGTFYPSEADILKTAIENSFRAGPGAPKRAEGRRRISALVAPHAGYCYSGSCAAYTYKALAEDGLPEAYIVIGPDHVGVPYEFVMSSEDFYTPLGPCRVHQEIAMKLRQLIPDDPRAHVREHSIEVQLPFLQYIDPNPKVIPIIMGRQNKQSAERLANAIRTACAGHDVVVIASSDLVHYAPKSLADTADREFLAAVASGNVDEVYDIVRRNNLTVCGYGPIATAMLASNSIPGTVLRQTDSSECSGDKESVVGYGSVAFYR
ncbi:MAG: AmmeMemoRadiSam system protein B [archaeon]|nr:AmmeMemoRadiSam system protein B [archaeon]